MRNHIARLAEKTYRQPIPLADLIVAATAVRHGLTLLTRNMDEMGRTHLRSCHLMRRAQAVGLGVRGFLLQDLDRVGRSANLAAPGNG